MIKKEAEGVEDIYGVHFKYQDLFSRLLKVQKERMKSEEKHSIPRMASFDNSLRQKSANKGKKKIGKKTGSVKEIKGRSISAKKIKPKVQSIDAKHDIFKSYSPSQKRKNKNSVQIKSSVKRKEKKNASTTRIIKKHIKHKILD